MNAQFAILAVTLAISPILAQEPADKRDDVAPNPTETTPDVASWGEQTDPDGDCRFDFKENRLSITVPGSDHPHDLGAEVGSMSAPRVTQPVKGDFTIEVRVDGVFIPKDESTQEGRTGYNGAGLLVMADAANYVRIERATLQGRGDKPHHYTNFEIRVAGKIQRFGTTGDRPLKGDGPVFLRLERKGAQIHGFVSDDNVTWDELPAKQLPPEWPEENSVGVAAISTSKEVFIPSFSELKLVVPDSKKEP